MHKLARRSFVTLGTLLVVTLSLLLLPGLFGQDDEPKTSKTKTKEELFATPKPPDGWYPFKEGTDYKPDDYENKLPKSEASTSCATKVSGIEIHDKGKIVGTLKYNLKQRSGGDAKETNGGNTDLGGVFDGGTILDWYHYKFEVEVSFTPNLEKSFYGQMATDPFTMDKKEDVKFHDDTPANDYIGMQWILRPSEKKSDFPVVEVQGNTVRWIDAPGGANQGNTTQIFIVYAGSCGKLTDVKVFKVEYPKKKKPQISYIDPPDKLKEQVKSFKFKPT